MGFARSVWSGVPLLLCLTATPVAGEDCAIDGEQATREDVARARAACQTARARFAELFGDTVPALLVVLEEEAGYQVSAEGGVGLVFWPSSAALSRRLGGGAQAARQVAVHWREVLPHEMMHALTIARFYDEGGVSRHEGYGTPLPDWFEEAVWIWGEPVESRRARVAQARSRWELGGALQTILRRPHPAAANRVLLNARAGTELPADEALWSFYPQAIAVLAFVYESGGRAAVSELARRLVRNPADEQPLVGLAGMSADPAGVVRAWEKWLEAGAER